MKKSMLFMIFFVFGILNSFGQIQIKGTVKDKDDNTLLGVNVFIKGTTTGTATDEDGKFTIKASLNNVLVFSYIGFETKEVTIKDKSDITIVLTENNSELDEVVVVGSRNPSRTATESAVPVDIISVKELATQGAQVNLGQILNVVAPSFTSNTQTVADGTDHIDPAQLRGLGPDQVLVLVNGKRRHTSSLVNINGTPGRGSVGTDMNAIPSYAIEKIEVLRDGASAQYGSDAIAGVINIGLKKNTGGFNAAVFSGANISKGSNDHSGGMDGANTQIDLNYGAGLGKEKSYINITASGQIRDYTSRAKDATDAIFNGYNAIERVTSANGININSLFGNIQNTPNTAQILSLIHTYAPQVNYFTAAQQSAIANANTIADMQTALNFNTTDNELIARGLQRKDFNMRVGQSSLQSGQVFLNVAYPFSEKIELYAFGGYSYREGNSAGFYRRPNQSRSYTGIYSNGFLPEIGSTVKDISRTIGMRGKMFKNWNYDLSYVFGKNSFDYGVENSSNASLRENSPTEFDAGGLRFSQNTFNFDVNRNFGKVNLAFGAEARAERFAIKAGQAESYNKYDINGNIVTENTPNNLQVTDFFGAERAGGAQVFPGFRPSNAISKGRSSGALYTDIEYDVTPKWLLNGAVRFESYSDFGQTLNYKLATRYKLTSKINIRGAIATGFRAPSLHQIYFNSTSTQFIGGVPFEVGTFSNDSEAAQLLGIPKLKQEESKSYSFGFTAKISDANLTISADAYMVNIDDRVVLTDQFSKPGGTPAVGTPAYQLNQLFDAAGANAATFFSNAIDTRSKGIDLVISHKLEFGEDISLKTDLSGTISKTERTGEIKGSDILIANGQINNYYSERSKIFLEQAIPRVKANITNSLAYKKFDFFLRNVYFGKVTDPNVADVNGDGVINSTIVNGQNVQNEHPVWGAKITTDLSIGYNITKNVKLVVGSNNIFDVYPDENLESLKSSNQFTYSRNVSQFGQNGRFVFGRISIKF